MLTMEETTVRLCDLDLTKVDQAWDQARANQSVSGKPLRISGQTFSHGVGTHASSELILKLNRNAKRFRALVGVDDGTDGKASLRFSVWGDGKELWNSGICTTGQAARPVDLDISKVRILQLKVDDGGDNNFHDHADWAEAVLEGVKSKPTVLDRMPGDDKVWLPGKRWLDTDGKRIQAHGGGLLYHDKRWWWYGEDRSDGYVAIGVGCYTSTDLLHWKHVGVVLPRAAYNQKHGDQTLCERPKVIYNPSTRQFVLWFHYDRSGYGDSQAGVAVADRPEGPFRFLGAHRPVAGATYRDMTLFVDNDGSAYAIYASEENATMHIVRLNAEWTAAEQPMVEGKTWSRVLVRRMREAPALFRHDGKYWLFTSGCTGWDPNPADIAVADRVLGPWTSLGNPCEGSGAGRTFESQSTAIIPSGRPNEFIYLGDRWNPKDLADARYIWLPLRFESGKPVMRWVDRWAPGK